ncbi:MAG: DUF503 domain-containing protein [Chloroflexi bacterium]|nr:DUF503 domain-containing protein [Chloroflexota bacterium]
MHVGVCQIKLHLPGSQSLKDKRQIIKSITSRLDNTYNISIAEIANQDLWQLATLGISCVGIEEGRTRELLYRIVDFVSSSGYQAEVTDYEVDVLSVF